MVGTGSGEALKRRFAMALNNRRVAAALKAVLKRTPDEVHLFFNLLRARFSERKFQQDEHVISLTPEAIETIA